MLDSMMRVCKYKPSFNISKGEENMENLGFVIALVSELGLIIGFGISLSLLLEQLAND